MGGEEKDYTENIRRMILKISTAIMISVVGPASAWSVNEEKGLMAYILVYIVAKFLASQMASRNAEIAIFSYRFAPFLLVISGSILLLSSHDLVFLFLLPTLLGTYEGAYWTVYFDYKGWKKESIVDGASGLHTNKSPIGVNQPSLENTIKAKGISVPFAACQFVVQNSMRFVALERGVLWLATLVVIAELAAYIIGLIYKKIRKSTTNEPEIEAKLWLRGQLVLLGGIVSMALGHLNEYFSIFLFGWLIAQGSARGILRKIEIGWAQSHLLGKKIPYKEDPDLAIFQRNEVIAACLGVGATMSLVALEQDPIASALLGSLAALVAFLLPFPKFDIHPHPDQSSREIGLRERYKFNAHMGMTLAAIPFALLLSLHLFILTMLLSGFLSSILAVVVADTPEFAPTTIAN